MCPGDSGGRAREVRIMDESKQETRVTGNNKRGRCFYEAVTVKVLEKNDAAWDLECRLEYTNRAGRRAGRLNNSWGIRMEEGREARQLTKSWDIRV